MDGRVKRRTFAELMAEAALQGTPEDKTTADLLNVPLSRGAILPLTEYLDRSEFDLSSGLPGAFADAVTAPARAARGEISEDQQIPEAFNFAGSLTLGSLLAPRPQNAVGMFGGRLAKTADQSALAKAEKMAAEGAPRDQIWNETGWFQGPDKQWRFEIDDSKASLGPIGNTLGDTLLHDDLFKAYPEATGIETRQGASLGKAHYSRGDAPSGVPPEIVVGSRAGKDTVLHEAQHGVQDIEGFATGGNIAMAFGAGRDGGAWPIYKEIIQKMKTAMPIDEYVRAAGFDAIDDAARASYDDYLKGLKKPIPPNLEKIAQQTAAEQYYKRLAGEAEARLVQKRADMSAEARRARPPWLDYDVPEADQIVKLFANAKTGAAVPLAGTATTQQDENQALIDALRAYVQATGKLPEGIY